MSSSLASILLIDVKSRRIVPYSSRTVIYLILSYRWGNAKQDLPDAGCAGTILGKLSKTMEDYITFVKDLGRRYLWVDSVCTNQNDKVQKLQQISIMG